MRGHLRVYEYREGIDTFTLALQGVAGITKCIYEPKRPPREFVTPGVVYAYASQIFDERFGIRRRASCSS